MGWDNFKNIFDAVNFYRYATLISGPRVVKVEYVLVIISPTKV
jgi:hypothetical protein